MSLENIDVCAVLKKAVTLAKGDRQRLASYACGLANLKKKISNYYKLCL